MVGRRFLFRLRFLLGALMASLRRAGMEKKRGVVARIKRAWFLFSLWTGLTAADPIEYVFFLPLALLLFVVFPFWLLRMMLSFAASIAFPNSAP